MENFGIFGVVILWILFNIFRRAFGSKKKNGNTPNKYQEAVEEQRRRRQAYESAHANEQKQEQSRKPMGGIFPKELEELFGLNVEPAPKKQSSLAPKTLHDAQSKGNQVVLPKALVRENQISKPKKIKPEAVSGVSAMSAKVEEVGACRIQSQDQPQLILQPFNKNQLVQGIIMAEILGPCRAKAKRMR